MTDTPNPNAVQRIVGWLRAGYPQGIPSQDYVALFGVLARKLTSTELDQIVDLIADELPQDEAPQITVKDVRDAIRNHVMQEPRPEDIARVSARLAAVGWPLADIPEGDQNPVSVS